MISKKIVAVLITFICLSTPVNTKANSTNLEISNLYTLPEFNIVQKSDQKPYVQIYGWYQVQNEAGFSLPRNIYKVKLPKDKNFVEFSVTNKIEERLTEEVDLEKMLIPATLTTQKSDIVNILNRSYSLCSFAFLQTDGFDTYAVFVINPFQYNEKTNTLTITKSFQIIIDLSDSVSFSQNPEIKAEDKYDYCIIAKKKQLPLFLEYKYCLEERGIKTILYPLESIFQISDNNKEQRLRHALNNLYLTNGIQAAMIVGSDTTIPMMRMYPYGKDTLIDQIIPSDFYYAELTAEWDWNSNGFFGELDKDKIDFSPEIAIGRIPFDYDTQILDYMNRLISFYVEKKENRKNVLSAGAWLTFKEELRSTNEIYDVDGGQVTYTNCQNYFGPTNYNYYGLSEKEGIKFSQVERFTSDLTYKNLISSINELDPLIILLAGHGSSSSIARKIWKVDKNYNKIAEENEIEYPVLLDLNSLQNINNNHQSIVFTDSCLTCDPRFISLGSKFLEKRAVGYFGSSSLSTYFLMHDANPNNYEINTSCFGLTTYVEKYFSDQYSLGESMRKGIFDYWNLCVNSDKRYLPYQIQNIYSLTFYGDPMIKLTDYSTTSTFDFQTQEKIERGNLSYNIKEISIAEEKNFYTIKCQIYEPFQQQNYQFLVDIDVDMDAKTGNPKSHGADYFFVVGFDKNREFLTGYLKWDNFLNNWEDDAEGLKFNRFSFNNQDSSVWIKFPKSMVKGALFRYRIAFCNPTKTEYSIYPVEGNSQDYFATYPKNGNILPPSKPIIKSIELINETVKLTIDPSIPRNYPIQGYEIFKRINQAEFRIHAILGNAELTFNDLEYIQDSVYYYKVRAFDNQIPSNFSDFSEELYVSLPKSSDDQKEPSNPSNPEKPKEPQDVILPKPAILSGKYNESNKSISLTWASSIMGTYPINGFDIYKGEYNSSIILLKSVDQNVLSFVDTDILIGKSYIYYIVTIDNQSPPNRSIPSNMAVLKVGGEAKSPVVINLQVGSLYAMVNEKFITLDLAPFSKSNRVFVPLRFIAEAFGAKIEWKEDDSRNGEGSIKIVIQKNDGTVLTISMHTLNKSAFLSLVKNGSTIETKEIILDVPAFIVKPVNRTVVPIRFVAESFGAIVDWNEETKTIGITLE